MPFGGDKQHKYFTLIQKQMNSTKEQIKHITATDGKQPVMCRFFKRVTLWKIIGLLVALLAWAGDAFLGWQSNIGYYFLGAIASWCVSENVT